ncbi:hypothetical protein CRG98_029185 [Punica granatum]|uniref:RING-type E3 ubiquitin transferase n=1 Tax=Punica granatum TaxID=22663 RepID=A0A2I0J2H1_PUNGR|nr:hypothetical protein CRG98_029185 [Punica granatum]
MGDSVNGLNNNAAVALTGKIMVVAIIVLFLAVVLVLFLHLYAKWFWWHVEEPPSPARHRQRRRRRFVFAPGQEPTSAAARRGLEPSVLRALPVLIFRPDEFKEGLECAVCLSELAEGEKARLLPKCNHGFHVDCIGMWFQSHTTCPLCRNPVSGPEVSGSANVDPAEGIRLSTSSSSSSFQSVDENFEGPNFPTNILYWGDETHVSSRNACLEEGTSSSSGPTSEGMLVIDIPRQAVENQNALLSPSTSGCAHEELKSPATKRLRSLKRLLSRDRKMSLTTSGDVEQAGGQNQPC